MKKMEEGMEPFRASFEGIKEVAFSILAISSVLLAVFIPVAFMDGIMGMFFNSFAMTVASGIAISYLVAVMFIPTIGARVLSAKESRFYYATEPMLKAVDKAYVWILKPLIRFKTLTILATIGLLVASATLKVGMTFLPMQDNSEFQITIKAPVGLNIETMKQKVIPVDAALKKDKNIEYSIVSIGYNAAKEINKARIYVKLTPVEKRKLSQEQIIQHYREKFKSIKNMSISVEKVDDFNTGGTTAPVQVVITGESLKVLDQTSQKLMALLHKTKGIVDVDRDFESGKPELRIKILRENAQKVGVSVKDIANILVSAYSSDSAVSYYEDNGRQFDVTVRFKDAFRESTKDLKKLQIRNNDGQLVSLDGLISITKATGTASINRFDRERKVLVTANIFGTSLDKIVTVIDKNIKNILPQGYNYRYTGDVENMNDTNKAFGAAVLLTVILIYLILAALYESLIQPFIIMISMPLSFTGVMVALYLSKNSFSLFVMIGVILLLGMVGKNAILVVDFAIYKFMYPLDRWLRKWYEKGEVK